MAECHPVGFQWVMEAKARGAKLIHVDPRFTRTSAVADLHVPLRAGSDIAFLGGIVSYVLSTSKYFRDYVLAYTNAPMILTEDFPDTEDLDGVFSGLDRGERHYDFHTWQYEGVEVQAASGERDQEYEDARVRQRVGGVRAGRPAARRTARAARPCQPAARSGTRRCSTRGASSRSLKRHFARYTPGDGGADLRRPGRSVPARSANGSRRTPAASGPPRSSTRRLDPAHGRGAVHPHRGDPAGAARQHRPAGRRHPGAARPRLHPGVHRHPDPVQPAARLHPDAARALERGPGRVRRRPSRRRRATGRTCAATR